MNKYSKEYKTKIYSTGITLVELIIAMCLLGVLAAIGIATYNGYIERANISKAISDISVISFKVRYFYQDENQYPDSLSEVQMGGLLDPWGNPYKYLNLQKNGNGGARRDKNLNPLNSDFDLYSIGKDGKTKLPITQKDSLDDLLRANDGKFIDLAANYSK